MHTPSPHLLHHPRPKHLSLRLTDPLPPCPRSDPHLQFVEEVALPPPEVAIDLAEQERNERELQEAVNAPLPADDDDELID
jgi:hypothetical protein